MLPKEDSLCLCSVVWQQENLSADWILHAPLSLVGLSLNCCVTSLPIGTNNVGVSLDLGFAGVALGVVPFLKKADGEVLKKNSVIGKCLFCIAS